MVTGPSPSAPATSSGDETDDEARTGTRQESSLWWRVAFPIALVALVLAIPALVYVGSTVVLDSSEGRQVAVVTDPAAPGWEASVDPTPLLGVAALDESGALDHLALLTLTGEGSGGVVVFPGDIAIEVPGIGNVPLSIVYENQGPEVVKEGLEGILGLGVPDLRVVQASEWADLVGPVGPLTVSNPDPVTAVEATGGSGVVFPKGSITLSAGQVAPYLTAEAEGQNDLARMTRVSAFWRAWLAGVAADPDGPTTVPGEVDSGLGLFVRTLAKGHTDVTDLPVVILPLPDGSGEVYQQRPVEVAELMGLLVPFPAGPEGKRARVRVLDGTGELDHGLGAAALMAAAGAQIDKVGNASEFDTPTTTFTYYDEAARSRVEALREAMGVGEIVRSDEVNVAVDVIVVLGEDYLAARRDTGVPGLRPTTSGDPGG